MREAVRAYVSQFPMYCRGVETKLFSLACIEFAVQKMFNALSVWLIKWNYLIPSMFLPVDVRVIET
jgi:hypothetical protein